MPHCGPPHFKSLIYECILESLLLIDKHLSQAIEQVENLHKQAILTTSNFSNNAQWRSYNELNDAALDNSP